MARRTVTRAPGSAPVRRDRRTATRGDAHAAGIDAVLLRERALSRFTLYALRERSPGALIGEAVIVVTGALDADLASVLECAADGRSLRVAAQRGAEESRIGSQIGIEGSQSGRALALYERVGGGTLEAPPPVAIEDLSADPELADSHRAVALGMRSSLCVVIPASGRPYGTLVASWRSHRKADDAAAAFLNAVANVLAAALERCRAAASLAESEARFRSLTELSSDWYWEQDAELRFNFLSDTAERRGHLSFDQVRGRRRWELRNVTPLSSGWDEHRALLEARKPFRNFEILYHDAAGAAHIHVMSGTPVYDAAGAFAGYRGVSRNITHLRRAEREIAERERLYRLIFESNPVPMYVHDRETFAILAANRQMTRQYGWTREELISMNALELRPHSERALVRAMLRGEVARDERGFRRHWRKDGEVFEVEATIHDFEFENRPARLVSPIDVSQRERTERALRESADNLRLLSRQLMTVQEDERRLLARELHDRIGQNLTALGINLELLRERTGRSAAGSFEQRLRDSVELTEATARVIGNLTSELHPPMLDDYGLGAALRWYAAQQAARSGLRIDVQLPHDGPEPMPERDLGLFRIAQEAITNVIKHAKAKRVEIALVEEHGGVQLLVRDDGVGLDAQAERQGAMRFGRRGMRERALAIGAQFEIAPAPGGGTIVTVRTGPGAGKGLDGRPGA